MRGHRLIVNWILSAACVLGAGAPCAFADATLQSEVDLREKAGSFTLFVPPDYPKALLPEGRKSTVDIFGTVQPDGSLAIDRVEAAETDQEFVREIRDVARFWMLRPGYNKGCEPVAAKAQIRVWFEVREGQPVVSFTQAKQLPDPDARKKKLDIRWARRPKIEYPTAALRNEREGMVEVIARVRPDGSIENLTYVPGPLVRIFGEAIRQGFRRVAFEPLPGDYKEPVCASYEVEFRITNIPSR